MGVQRAGDVGLLYIPRSSITGRIWNDANYDGIQAGQMVDVIGEDQNPTGEQRFEFDPSEPGMANQMVHLTQWFYVPASQWSGYKADHASAATKLATDYDEVVEKTGGVWLRNEQFGYDLYSSNASSILKADGTVDMTRVAPLVTGGVSYDVDGDDVTGRDTSKDWYDVANGTATINNRADDATYRGVVSVLTDENGVYAFDNLPTAFIDRNMTDGGETYYLAGYRVELDQTYYQTKANGRDETTNHWILTRNGAGDDAALDSDAANANVHGAADGIVVAGTLRDAAVTERQNDGQIILAQPVAADAEGTTFAQVKVSAANSENGVEGSYDWAAYDKDALTVDEATGQVKTALPPFAGGDVGMAAAPRQAISGYLWNDEDNDGVRDEGEPGVSGLRVAVERWYITATEQPDGSYAVGADATWQRDTDDWAPVESWNAYEADPVSGLAWKKADDRVVTTDADGRFSLDELPSQKFIPASDATTGEGEEAVTAYRIYGYRLRVVDTQVWDRNYHVAKYLQTADGATYQTDSDLVYDSGYLMAEGEYDVLLNAYQATEQNATTPASNRATVPNAKNPNQVDADRYGTDGTDGKADGAWTEATTYNLGLGADKAFNDGGLRVPAAQKIAGTLWADADYDGIREEGESGLAGKRVILKQWYYAPVTEMQEPAEEGGDRTETTTWKWVLNENFNGNGSKFNVVAVPNLDGMAEDEAVKALADAGLIANVVKGAAAPSADRAGTVYEQAPKSGGTLLVGSKVTITVYDAYVEPETSWMRTRSRRAIRCSTPRRWALTCSPICPPASSRPTTRRPWAPSIWPATPLRRSVATTSGP